ncbi:MAG: hypothetical protein AB7J46_06230 [Candidatus Altimarinota bacterium]
MDLRVFAASLSQREADELSSILFEMKKKQAAEKAQSLTSEEMALVARHQIADAVIHYRRRLNCSMLEAKVAVDIFRETTKQ